jgi:hypothetical protein
MRSFAVAVVVLGCLASCGDGGGTDEPIAIPPRLAITAAPATLAVGAPWPMELAIEGDLAGSELVVVLRPPAAPVPGPDDARFVMTGALVGGGPPQWLAADGSWSATEVAHDAAPAAGPRTISLVLPAATAGEWRAIVMLREADGGPHALASAAVLVGDSPALRVAIDRTWAGELDIVSATAQIATAGREDLQLVAWLTLPDESQLALPEMSPTFRVVPRTVADEAFPLLARDFAAYGPGDYRVAARLVDAGGNLLAAGGAGFTVCTTPGSLDGTIVDAAGAPVTFDAETVLTAIALDRPRANVQVPIATDGSFHAELAVGSWAIAGRPIDGAGTRALEPAIVDVGCAGPVTIQVVAGAPSGIGRRRPSRSPHVVARGGPAPKIKALGMAARQGAASDLEAQTFASAIFIDIRNALSSDVVLTTHSDVADLARLVMLQQQLGSDEKAVQNLGTLSTDYDYLVVVWVLKGSSRWTVTINFAAPDGTILSRKQATSSSLTDLDQFLNGQLPSLAAQVAVEAETKIRQRTSSGPSEPVVSATISPDAPVKGGPIRLTIHLKDYDTCEPAAAGTEVTFDYDLSPTVRGYVDVPVDASGTATLELTVPEDGNRVVLRPSYAAGIANRIKGLSAVAYYRDVSNVEITLDRIKSTPFKVIKATLRALLPPGTLPVAPLPAADGMPAAFTTFVVAATEGTVPTAVTTNEQGVAAFDWLIGDGGLTNVGATAPSVGGDLAGVHVEAAHVLDVEVFPTDVALVDTPLEIRARVTLDNAVPGVGVPVVMSVVSGGGAGGRSATDENGRAMLPFRTPALEGDTELVVRATYDGAHVSKTIRITTRAPCAPSCPPVVVTTDDADGAVAKGGTIRFFANQDVTWSATGGSISAGGVLTADSDGGVWTVTAFSNENPGTSGARDYIVDCDDADLIGAYPVQQDVTVFDAGMSCADGAPALGTFEILMHPFPIDPGTADARYTISPTCGASFGIGELQFMPRIEHCTLSQVVTFSGCPVEAFTASAVGPGVSGLTGTYTHRFYDLAATTCTDVHSIFFEPPPP